MSCAECEGDLPSIYDVAELEASVERHPAAQSSLQRRVEELRVKSRVTHLSRYAKKGGPQTNLPLSDDLSQDVG